jgi:hypothetical protein
VVQHDCRARLKQNDCDFTVSAELAREHLLRLRGAQVGKRAVSECTGIAAQVLMSIANGTRRRIRRSTEEKIMRTSAAGRAGGSSVCGKETTRLIDEMLDAGYSIKSLAARLGYKYPEIQFHGHAFITATNAMRVEKLHTILLGSRRIERMVQISARIAQLKKHLRKAA